MFSGPESSRSTPAVGCSGFSSQQWCTVPRGLCPNSEVQVRCCCRSTGNAQRAQKDMCEGQCARSEMEAGPSFGRWSHLVIPFRKGAGSHLPVSFFPLFPLSRRLFQSFAGLRLGCCSSNIQPNCIHGGFIFICLWASIVLYPTQGFSLRASSPPQAENIHPLTAFLTALLVSILDCLENPLQLLSILKDCSVHCALCNTSAFLVSVGHIPWHGKSEFLQGKARRYRGVLAGAMA